MKFTYTEINGDKKSIYSWLAKQIEEFAKEKYGLDIVVTFNEDEEDGGAKS